MYYAKVLLRHTAADAAGSAVWAMHNPPGSGARIFMRDIDLNLSFDGTLAAASNVGYELWRFTTADPTAGSTVPRIKRKTQQAASVIADANIQQRSGILTMTSVVYDTDAFSAVIVPASITGAYRSHRLEYPSSDVLFNETAFILEQNEGLAIRVATGFTAIIGQNLSGHISWSERPLNR